MSRIILITRSFHPDSDFGLGGFGFHGDNRGFKYDLGVTSRIRHQVTLSLNPNRIVDNKPISDPSVSAGGFVTERYTNPDKQPTGGTTGHITPYRADGDQHGSIVVTYAGQNFAMPMSDRFIDFYKTVVPILDVTNNIQLHIDRTQKKIQISCRLVGDGFPNCETFMIDSGGQACFLASHVRVGSASGQLWDNRKIAMCSTLITADWTAADTFGANVQCDVCIDYASPSGGPVDLKAGYAPNPGSLSSWNRLHTGRDASGDWIRQWLDNDVARTFNNERLESMPGRLPSPGDASRFR